MFLDESFSIMKVFYNVLLFVCNLNSLYYMALSVLAFRHILLQNLATSLLAVLPKRQVL